LASDEHLQITVERVLTGLRGPLEAALRADSEKAVDEVRRQAEEQLEQLRATARKENDDLRTSAETQIAELKGMLDEIRSTAEQQIDTARRTLETEVAAVRTRATAEVEDVTRTSDERLRAVTRELEASRLQLDAARMDVDAAWRDADAARKEAEAARKDAEAARGDAAAHITRPEPLADDLRSLDEATSLSDVLERLTQAAVRHVGRAALLIVKNERLRRWQAVGFDAHHLDASVDLSPDEAGIAATALRDRRAATRAAGERGRVPAFAAGADSRDAAAFPVMVAGAVVAVLYADAPGGAGDARRWQDDLDVLARYTSRVLETITVQHATGRRAVHAVARPSQPGDAQPVPRRLA
jgi:hypothetical protein